MREGWEIKPLGEVCTLQRGFDLPKGNRTEGRYPLVSSSGVIDTHSEYKVRGPGVATGRSGSIGGVFFIDEDFWPLNTVLYVKEFHGNDPRFIYYLLIHFDLSKYAGGTGVPTLNRNNVHDVLVAVPKLLAEQQRIVAILDEAFQNLATAITNAEKNLKHVRELFAASVGAIFGVDHDDWTETTLGAIAEFKNGLNFTRSSKGETVRIVGVKDFQDNFWVPEHDLEAIQIQGGLSDAYLLRKDDILAVRSNGNKQLIGRTILATDISERTSHSGFTIRIRITDPAVNPEYLVRYLKSGAARKTLIDSGDGAQISNLNQQALDSLPVRLPSPAKQKMIAKHVAALEVEVNKLEAAYRQRVWSLTTLKQSILRKAFTGELAANVLEVATVARRRSDQRRDTAMVLALAYHRHKFHNRHGSLGHTKEQKILHMVEDEADFDLGRQPIRDAAGPNDSHHMRIAEEWAESGNYFRVLKAQSGRYYFETLLKFKELIDEARQIDPTALLKIEAIIDLFVPMDSQQAEVFATVYAAWNNLLIDGKTPSDEEIVRAAREDWHIKKLEIPRIKFFDGIQQIKQSHLIPDGTGRYVPPPAQGQLSL